MDRSRRRIKSSRQIRASTGLQRESFFAPTHLPAPRSTEGAREKKTTANLVPPPPPPPKPLLPTRATRGAGDAGRVGGSHLTSTGVGAVRQFTTV